MEIHHSKHHNTYVTNLNAAMPKLKAAEEKGDVTAIVQLQAAIKFNGGGHMNHTIFWQVRALTAARAHSNQRCALRVQRSA
jgi:superoxide dismutase, Fe-Mn family